MSLLFAIGLATAPIATADTCDNATLRAQNNSTGLPDCRAYEMVTQPYKQGSRVFAGQALFTDDGVYRYQSGGSFAGNGRAVMLNSYNATRSAAGWATTALAAPDPILDSGGAAAFAWSADLRWALTTAMRRALPGDTLGFYLRDPDGGFTRIGDAVDPSGEPSLFAGGSDDLSHVVFVINSRSYEYVGTGNASARAVSVKNDGQVCDDPSSGPEISPDGRVIIFMSGCSGPSLQVWARVAGSATVAVSGSECTRSAADPGGVCNGVSDAAYVGRSADGSRVFFTTSQQLVNADVDQTSDLYACDIPPGEPAPVGAANPCASLTRVSGTVNGAAQVASVPVVSADGSRAYFVADGAALADNVGVNGAAPVAGESNLYLWIEDAAHPAGQIRFVAKLDTNDLAGGGHRSQLTPDGRYLLFATANQLVKTGLGADNDLVKDAYRYDASTDSIVRVSTSVSGGGGNDPGSDISLAEEASAMAADGSTVIFDTAEGLSAADTNGVTDVYSWRDGQVSLISAGGGTSLGITASGRDIFFETDVPVVAADGDANTDVYTARVGGGFPVAKAVPCSGDGCQGQRSQSPSLAAPLAPATGSGDILLGQRSVVSLKRVSAKRLKAASRTGVLPVLVTSSSAGKLSVSARASLGRVAGKTVRVREAGTVKIRLSLSSGARQRLRSGRPLRIKLSVTKQGARTRSSSVLLPGTSS